jgi:hypothetical protein
MRRSWKTYALAAPLLLVTVAAGIFTWGQLQPKPPGYAPNAATEAEPAAAAIVEAPGDPIRLTIDARDRSMWIFLDLERAIVVDSAFEASDWDLAFRRTNLVTNSGLTNPQGPGGAINLGEIALEVATLPAGLDFAVDAAAGEDGDEVRNPAIEKWYRYDFIRHVVVARDNVYAVRTGTALDALVQFVSYYCDDGTPGCVTLRYRLVSREAA